MRETRPSTTFHPLPEIDRNRCNGCGICVSLCPTQAVALRDGYAVIVDANACNFCPICESYCLQGAIGRPFTIAFYHTTAR
nr:4Fe-4S binding protein [Chloroflexus sp. Y-396-1]